jgi:hypothetical protein
MGTGAVGSCHSISISEYRLAFQVTGGKIAGGVAHSGSGQTVATEQRMNSPPVRSESSEPGARRPGWFSFGLAIFSSAFLLFQIQPLIAKYILPWFGGGPGVWTTCMLFFQVFLLAGYACAHFTTQLYE